MQCYTEHGLSKWHIVKEIEEGVYGKRNAHYKKVHTVCGKTMSVSKSLGRFSDDIEYLKSCDSMCSSCNKVRNTYPELINLSEYDKLKALKTWSLKYAGTDELKISSYLLKKGWFGYPGKTGTVPVGLVLFLDITKGSRTVCYYNQDFYIAEITDFQHIGMDYVFFNKLS